MPNSSLFKNLKFQQFAPILILFLLCTVAYFPAFQGSSVWDDHRYVFQSEAVISPDGLPQIWNHERMDVNFWPVSNTLFWLQFRFFGMNTMGYHAVNIAGHAINAILLGLILLRLQVAGAWWIASLFAVHPVQVETVAWISEFKNINCLFFYLLSIYCYLKHHLEQKKYSYGLAILFFAMSMLAKTAAVALPLVLTLILIYRRELTRKKALELLPFYLVMLSLTFLFIYQEALNQSTSGFGVGIYFTQRLLAASESFFFYPYKLLIPYPLAIIYPQWNLEIWDRSNWWGFLLALLFVVFMIMLWRRGYRGTFLCILFYAFNIAPLLGFVDHMMMGSSFVADHYQYIACIGILVLYVNIAILLWKKFHGLIFVETQSNAVSQKVNRFVPPLLGSLILFVLIGLSYQHSGFYIDSKTLWTEAVRANPKSLFALGNLINIYIADEVFSEKPLELLQQYEKVMVKDKEPYYLRGRVYAKLGRYQEALKELDQLILDNPKNSEGYVARAETNMGKGDFNSAVEDYSRALEISKENYHVYAFRAAAYERMNRNEEAVADYEKSVSIKRNQDRVLYNLATLYLKMGNNDLALKYFNECLRWNEKLALAYNNRGRIYQEQKRHDLAIADFTKCIKYNDTLSEPYFNRGFSQISNNSFTQAESDLSKAIELGFKTDKSYYFRGLANQYLKNYESAEKDYTQTLEYEKNYLFAYVNRGLVRHQLNKLQEALSDFDQAIALSPEFPNSYVNRGLLKVIGLKDNAGGCQDWKKACELGNCGNFEASKKNGVCNQ